MRRVLSSVPKRYGRHASYVGGLFNFRVISGEMFPYPSRKLDNDESETVQTLIEQIRSNDKELNLAGARVATEYGGLGLGHTAHALVCEEVGTSGDSKLLQTIQHCGLASYLLSTIGSKEVKGKYLTGMSDGKIMMGWAAQEECGNDISMNTAHAAFTSAGTYAITGAKRCDFAESATHYLVLAKTLTQAATEAGPAEVSRNSFFIVEKGSQGVTASGNTVTFDGAPVADIVGVIGEGFKDRMITLFTEQYVYASTLLGILKRVVQELRDSVPEQWAANTIASCACIMYAMESSLYALVANLDLPTEDSLLEAALTSVFLQNGTNEWLSVLSTATPTSEVLEKCFANARQLLSMMEASDFLYSSAVCCGIEDYGLVFQRTSTLQMVQLRTMRSFGMKDRIPVRELDCSAIDSAVVNFGNAVEATFVRNASQVPQQQLIINRLGEAAALLYAASASASRAAMCHSKRLPTAKTEKQLASTFIAMATERANRLSEECCNIGMTADDSYKRIAVELCDDALRS
ncbi:putative mitochondrial acyl-CoA dehydrogenase, mitochondrial precursor [Leptomonas pyrrhocoris]|uniref:Putative mitochondrial acyl-CoA dehydrogenase, mitochondrial n=1 Tax=Leptomonas pyrrhocoris TaxID=157538 RepID=A0A0N0DR84_LEPPY|nr:putative mitochondrial acyl-CoA dehydrogenase, mitochondrial precursor [Leptomonas pyrrhocoris]XP_015652782.1 putative mitochondrial acyl-CoA dehydrogenase, mitochondrial precursor [Leptomonas pyrrhocoris]KPA74342.1 putative mitochondrial acyl-CoA dehydrogenase, mitochondrial precursor [Leptomonas pyrrhocoris]KPA74343.1 putative mitochondrial acyl-CoA dehydrogenase, mitochondrial precursor [Leptomonas pyrrhocoris]|eukprot:XP_015652781.1 putative mitochondrial acyl-CoA dehydrogenase, mitochondrial precursor [Leptomonas pyrrhocoris]